MAPDEMVLVMSSGHENTIWAVGWTLCWKLAKTFQGLLVSFVYCEMKGMIRTSYLMAKSVNKTSQIGARQ